MYLHLFLLLAVATAKVPTRRLSDEDKSVQLYEQNCWQCHGQAALGAGPASAGMTPAPPALAGRDLGDQEATVELLQEGRGAMPGFAEVFDRHDSRRLVKWLQALDAEQGRPVKAPPPPPAKDTAPDPGDHD